MDQPNLKMRQRRWLDVVKEYDCEILYHLGKANVIPKELSRKKNQYDNEGYQFKNDSYHSST